MTYRSNNRSFKFNLVDPHVRNTIETPPGGWVGSQNKTD